MEEDLQEEGFEPEKEELKNFCLSIGVRGTVLGYDAIASYSRQRGKACFQGLVRVEHEKLSELVGLMSEELAQRMEKLLPGYLENLSAKLRFVTNYDHEAIYVTTDDLYFAAVGMAEGNGKACLLQLTEAVYQHEIGSLVKRAKEFFGLQSFFLFLENGQGVDINKLFPAAKSGDIVVPKRLLAAGGFYLYADYRFDSAKCFLNEFLYRLLGIEKLAFFAGKNEKGACFVLSVPKISNPILSVEELNFRLEVSQNSSFWAEGKIIFAAVPEITFGVSCQMAPGSILLSAAAIVQQPVNLFGEFYIGSCGLTVGYEKDGLIFGLFGEFYLRKLYLFAAIQLAIYGELVKPQLVSFSTGELTICSLVESISGIYLPELKLMDSIIAIRYFDLDFSGKFDVKWFEQKDIASIVSFFNEKIGDGSARLSEDAVTVGQIPCKNGPFGDEEIMQADAGGFDLVDGRRMVHYYVDTGGALFLRPQFYYSDVANSFSLPNGMVVSAGIFFCAKIRILGIDIKALFSFRQNEGVIAYAAVGTIELGPLKISESDYSMDNPIPIPDNSLLYQFLDKRAKGVVFFLQASKKDVSCYFDGKIDILNGLLRKQAQLYFVRGRVILNVESTLLGMTTKFSVDADYQGLSSFHFKLMLSFETYGLEQKLKGFIQKLDQAIERCRKKIDSAKQSLIDARYKVEKLYGEIDVLKRKVDDCRHRLKNMGWLKKIFWAPIIGCEIAGLEIAIGALYASLYVAQAALAVAEAAVDLSGKLGEGVLEVVKGVIKSVTSLFYIRRLSAVAEMGTGSQALEFSLEFVAIGKEYRCAWRLEHDAVKDAAKGISAISDAMGKAAGPDIEDLGNGSVSGRHILQGEAEYHRKLASYEAAEKLFSLEAAVGMLEKNAEMVQFLHDEYMEEFGEDHYAFGEGENDYLEILGAIEANIGVSENAADLKSLEGVVDRLRTMQFSTENGKASQVNDAVSKYDQACRYEKDLQILLEHLRTSQMTLRDARNIRRENLNSRMRARGLREERYNQTMYDYMVTVRAKIKEIYENAPGVYTNPYSDVQIQETLQQAQEYYRVND